MNLWLTWTLITALGWLVSAYLGSFIGFGGDATSFFPFLSIENDLEWGVAYGLAYGLIIGVSSWLFLRNRVNLPIAWIPLTILGFTAGNGLASYVLYGVVYNTIDIFNSSLDLFIDGLYGVVNGVCVALCQSLVLRTTRLNPWTWFRATWAGMVLGEFIGWTLFLRIANEFIRDQTTLGFTHNWPTVIDTAAGSIAGLVVGAMTGIVLISIPASSPQDSL